MEPTLAHKVIVQQLKNMNAEEDRIIGIGLMFQKSEESLIDLILWIDDNNPTLDETIEKAVEIYKNLPPELRPKGSWLSSVG